MSNNIYDIMAKLNSVEPKQEETKEETVYENVEPRGSIIDAVKSLASKYEDFVAEENKQLDERQYSDKKTFDQLAEPGDTYKTADGGTVTKTEKGIKHSAPSGKYGAGPEDENDLDENTSKNTSEEPLEEGKEDLRNHPIYTKEEAWDQYQKELAEQEQEQEETVDINTELDEISRLAGLAEKVGGNKSHDFVDDVHKKDKEDCQEDADEQWQERDVDVPMGEEALAEGPTRKDFQMVADLLKNIEDEDKKVELANHHADTFAKQNPRFDKARFLSAVGLNEEQVAEACGKKYKKMAEEDTIDEAEFEITYKDPQFTGTKTHTVKAVNAKGAEQKFLSFGNPHKVLDVKKKGKTEDKDEEVEEGNEFSGALAKAKAEGKKEFEVDGKTYKVEEAMKEDKQVNEDISINITANGEEDALKLIMKLAGIQAVAVQQETVEEERDIEYVNTPKEQVAPVSAAVPSGTDYHKAKKQDPATANKAANPLAEDEEDTLEESLWDSYKSMIAEVKKDENA